MTKTMMVVYAVGIFLLGALIALGGEHLLFMQHDQRDKMETVGSLGDWRLTCPPRTTKKAFCLVQSVVVQKGTNNNVAEITIAPKDNAHPDADQMTIVVPLGVFMPPGLRLAIGTLDKTIAFKTCLQVGCIAALPMDSTLASALANNTGGSITVATIDGKTVPLDFSLRGYTDALADRSADMAARK
jgi:invasion protein IalB